MQDDNTERFRSLTREFLPKKGETPDDAIKKLGKVKNLGRNEAVPLLNHLAGMEKHPKILFYIVKEMGRYKDKTSARILIELLTGFKENKDKYIDVKSAAATILGNIKEESAIVPLMYVMNDREESYRTRLWAADALGKIGNSQAVIPLMKIVSDEEEKSVYLKESAAKALGMIGDERAVESLINILETRQGMFDKFTYLKEKAVEALGKLGHKKESRIKALKNVLNDESPHVRASAVQALSEIEDDDITSVIKPMIYDSNESVCKTAVCALYNREGREYILKLLEKKDMSSVCKQEIMEILAEDEDYEEEEEQEE